MKLIINKKYFICLIIFFLTNVVQAQYTFPVPFIEFERIDRSNTSFPWVYWGDETLELERETSQSGCPGTAPNGAPVRVRCNQPNYILGSQYTCPSFFRDLHVGDNVIGKLSTSTTPTSTSDGYNPDGCIATRIGNIPVLTRSRQLYLAGGRWACPSGSSYVDLNNDGSKYSDHLKQNPEACGRYSCPTGSALAYAPNDPKSSKYYDSFGYICKGLNPIKQTRNVSCSLLNNTPDPQVGNPILIANGNKFQTETDYQNTAALGLSFIRYYNSTAYESKSYIGTKWTQSYSQQVSATGTNALVYRENGQAFVFNFNGTAWQGDVDIPDTLVEVRDSNDMRAGWIYTDSQDMVETYNADGQLLSITNRAGQTQTLLYDVSSAEGGDDNTATLDKVTGFAGEVMSFAYDANQRISTMTDPEGQVYAYEYDAAGNLISVTYPDDTPADNADNPTRLYHYENVDFPHHLTGITDENGQRYATWTYDTEGRAISSEHADGVDNTTLAFHTDGSVTTTNPLGKDTTYHFTTLHGVKKVTQVEGHATESCAGANQNYTYDANGYLASKTDWQGNITTYTHNSRGLEISRTEAVGTPAERTITTQWHEDFRLPTQITEPGKITTYSYDASGHQISQSITEQ